MYHSTSLSFTKSVLLVVVVVVSLVVVVLVDVVVVVDSVSSGFGPIRIGMSTAAISIAVINIPINIRQIDEHLLDDAPATATGAVGLEQIQHMIRGR